MSDKPSQLSEHEQWCPPPQRPLLQPGDEAMISENVSGIYAGYRGKVVRTNQYGVVIAVENGKGHTIELQYQDWALEKL